MAHLQIEASLAIGMSLDLSIVIVNFNSDFWLNQCLESIYRLVTKLKLEVIVVDNGSKHDNLNLHKSIFGSIKTIRSERQVSLSKAVNMGIDISSGKYVLWLNPDAVFLTTSIDDWIEYMECNPKVGISGPKVFDDAERQQLQYSCRRFPSLINTLFNRNSLLTKIFPNNKISKEYLMSGWDHSQTREVDWVSGCCMLLRREMLDQIGMLDEAFPLFCEDIDICLRAHQQGWSTVYFPKMEIVHYTGSVRAQTPFQAIVKEHDSLWQYYKKHHAKTWLVHGVVYAAIRVRLVFRLAAMALKRQLAG